MNKRGFTLIELLAVIVILSLLALITTTSVSKIVNSSKKDLSVTQFALIKSGAKIWGSENRDRLPDVGECIYITLFDLKNYGIMDNSINDPKNNQQIPNDLKIKISNTLSVYGKEIINYEVNPSSVDECEYGIEKPCSYTKDDKGYDMVTCGTESFYIMSENEEDETITMLAQYNLDVGYYYTSSDSYIEIPNPTGIQNPSAKGVLYGALSDYSNTYGTIAFSTTDYWSSTPQTYPAWVYGDYKDENGNQQNIIFPHVENYKRYLIDTLGVDVKEATLMSYEQAVELGCVYGSSYFTGTCGPDLGSGSLDDPAPEWVWSTSYWLGNAQEGIGLSKTILFIQTNGRFGSSTYYSGSSVNGNITYSYGLGVRPVITISTFNVG